LLNVLRVITSSGVCGGLSEKGDVKQHEIQDAPTTFSGTQKTAVSYANLLLLA
jgi:hypothetical protein